MNPNTRNLGLALLATVAVSAWSIWQGADEAQAVTPAPAASRPMSAPVESLAWSGHLRELVGAPVKGDPFRGGRAAPAVAAVPAASIQRAAHVSAAKQTPAEAPVETLPFTYMGKLERDGTLDVYLEIGGGPLIARVGQTLPGGWRFDGIESGTLSFTHIASHQKRTLSQKVNQ